MEFYNGIFTGTPHGYGFVHVNTFEKDIFIPADKTATALDGDTVQVALLPSARMDKGQEGCIRKILSRSSSHLTGTYIKHKNYGFVHPDNPRISHDIYIQNRDCGQAKNGSKVTVRITDYGTAGRHPQGRITEVFGHINHPSSDTISIIKAYDLPEEFPAEVTRILHKIPDEVREKDLHGRRDLRTLLTVTIDGEDARDLDDAVSLSVHDGSYFLGVHIADVSHYVFEDSPLDREAARRSTSIYLTDRVIPMLPKKLSNQICSLNEGCDRLTLSCLMEIDKKGHVVDHEIVESVIRSDRRMNYTQVDAILAGDPQSTDKYQDFVPLIHLMKELSVLLHQRRMQRGGIDFDLPEAKITINENGLPTDIRPYPRNAATMIIEEFMLAANETIAADACWQELPFLYRTHEAPDTKKIEQLTAVISAFGYSLRTGHQTLHPHEFQKLLARIQQTPEEALISRLVLRSMRQAKYSVHNSGHFGLAADHYCHFTSPIRRYPDLLIHRIIKENIHGRLDEQRRQHYDAILPGLAESTSRLERRADDAQRALEKLKKLEYMSARIGKIYAGIICGFSRAGMYVGLKNTCEGFVAFSDIENDNYRYDAQNLCAFGELTKKTYTLGQRLAICVAETDKTAQTVYFVLADEYSTEEREWLRKANT